MSTVSRGSGAVGSDAVGSDAVGSDPVGSAARPARARRWYPAMGRALAEARAALATADVPVGAVVVDEHGTVLGRGRNAREADADPTAHAEVVALRAAARARGGWRLEGCTLVVTLEPCTMCAGAAVLARVDRVVFGAYDDKAGAVGSLWDVVRDRRLNHRPEVVAEVRAAEQTALLEEFFAPQREASHSWTPAAGWESGEGDPDPVPREDSMAEDMSVTDNPDESQYEARLDGELAGRAVYRRDGDVLDFVHTEVGDGFTGRGIAGTLVRSALDDVAARGTGHVRASCPYVRRWLDRHPEYQYLDVDESSEDDD